MSENPLSNLNAEQIKAVTATSGPVLVLAGAGSGKTRALTHRIAYLIQQKIAHPQEILAVTFTNKAAKEMRYRIIDLLGNNALTPKDICTFHSLGVKILREQYKHTKRSASFTIFDESDAEKLIRSALLFLNNSRKEWTPKNLKRSISKAKNSLVSPQELLANANNEKEEFTAKVYKRYQYLLAQNNGYDFDDLILETIKLLQENSDVKKQYRQRWQHILVDEYQDTNPSQSLLINLLLNKNKNLCVVGDDYQAIYSWRGAKVDHILKFEKDFPGCTTVYLTQNYRSTPTILSAANAIIEQNKTQKHKKLWTEEKTNTPVQLVSLPSDYKEVAWVRKDIDDYAKNNGHLKDCAVLYRTNAQSRLLEEEFIRHKLPYTVIGGVRFYSRAEVKDAMAFIQLWVNPLSTIALQRVAQSTLVGIGPKALNLINDETSKTNKTLLDVIVMPTMLTSRQQQIFLPLVQAWVEAKKLKYNNVGELLKLLLNKSGYIKRLERLPDFDDRMENIEELYSLSSEYEDPSSLVEEVALMSDIDAAPDNNDKVMCMTLHAAKGLEFEKVFLIGCEENLLPHQNSLDSTEQVEEERRLLYVGMTRAKKSLSLSYAETRSIHGESRSQAPSRFLESLPDTVKRLSGDDYTVDNNDDFLQANTSSAEQPVLTSFDAGDVLTHPTFGRGVVIQVLSTSVVCVFEGHGVKTLNMQIAMSLCGKSN